MLVVVVLAVVVVVVVVLLVVVVVWLLFVMLGVVIQLQMVVRTAGMLVVPERLVGVIFC